MDLFVDEDVEYARRLMDAGVSTELHLYRGAVHGFEMFVPEAQVLRRFLRHRDEVFRAAFGLSVRPAE